MTKRFSQNNKIKLTSNKYVHRFANKLLQSGKKKTIKNLIFKVQLALKNHTNLKSFKNLLWNKVDFLLNPVEVKTWEPLRKGQGKIGTTTLKKLKAKLKKFNTILTFPVRPSKQYTKVLSLLGKQTVLKTINNKYGLRKNMQKRLLVSVLNLIEIKKSKLYKNKIRQQTVATNIKITSVSKSKRWY